MRCMSYYVLLVFRYAAAAIQLISASVIAVKYFIAAMICMSYI